MVSVTLTFGQDVKQDTTKIGFYITSIHDLNYVENSFEIDLWFWRTNPTKDLSNYHLFQPRNAKESSKLFSSKEFEDQDENVIISGVDTTFWDYDQYKCKVNHYFDLKRYPFDREYLSIEFEELTNYGQLVYLEIDKKESGIAKFEIKGWDIGQMEIEPFQSRYETNYGNPSDTVRYSYSGVRVVIPIKRQGLGLFFKLFTGLFVAFVIALLSLKINISEADARFGVCVGALFAAIANMYIVTSDLPTAAQFTLLDICHMITVFLILALFIVSTFSLTLFRRKKQRRSQAIDTRAFWIIGATFLLANIVTLWVMLN